MLIGGAAINRAFSYRALYPGGKDSEEAYAPGVFYCKDAFEGLSVMDQLIDEDAHAALLEKLRTGATAFRAKGEEPVEDLNFADDSVRCAARTDVPIPRPPFWGVKEIPVNLDEVYPHLESTSCSSCTGAAKASKARPGRRSCATISAASRADVARADLSAPRALLGFFPCYSAGNDIVVLDPQDRETELTASPARAGRRATGSSSPTSAGRGDAAGEPSAKGSPPAEST